MGCTKCGTDLSSLHLIVKDIIRQLIDEGKLQEGLVDCTDKRLWRDSRVLTCDLLGDAVCQLITNGDICLVKPEALTVEKQDNGSHKISLLMSDGTTLETTARLADGVLNSVTYDAKTKTAKFTTTNGDSYEIKLDIPEPVEYTFTKKDDGVYSVAKDGKELLAINPGVLDVKIEGDKLHVTNAAGEVKQFDIPMPTVTPTELTDNGDGTGSVKYGDKALSVMTRPTTATKAEDGTVTITNSNGTEVTMTIPNCPDTLLVDAFDKVEVGYIHSATCDKSELEKEPEPKPEPDNRSVNIAVSAHLTTYTADTVEIIVDRKGNTLSPDLVISGVAKTYVIANDNAGFGKVLNPSPVENTVAFSAKYSEFPLHKQITPPPQDIGTTDKWCLSSINFSASTENVTTSDATINAESVAGLSYLATGACL